MQTLKNHGKQLWRQNYNKFSLIYCDASGLVSINYILNLDSESHFMVDQHFEKKQIVRISYQCVERFFDTQRITNSLTLLIRKNT